MRQAVEAKGCQLLFLPAYSPDLSPIEEAFSKVKAYLRRLGARTHEALVEAIAQALLTVAAQDGGAYILSNALVDGEQLLADMLLGLHFHKDLELRL